MSKWTCPNCLRKLAGAHAVHNCMRVRRSDSGKKRQVAQSKPKLYLLHLWGDVEPHLHGPYMGEATRLRAAKRERKEYPDDGLFKIDCATKPDVSSFHGDELEGGFR